MASNLPLPNIVKELDFKVIQEPWVAIKLKDGTVIKFRSVLMKVFETDTKNPTTGGIMLAFESQNIASVTSPKELLGKPSEKLPPDIPSALKMPKQEIEVREVSDLGWNIYELKGGKKIKSKPIITNVYKIKGIYDQRGNPYYVILSALASGESEVTETESS
jgi:hypothetical protein